VPWPNFERQLIRDRTLAGPEAARARGRRGGRPTVMTAARIETARSLLAVPRATVASVAKNLGVNRATLYRTVLGEETSAPRPCPDASEGVAGGSGGGVGGHG